MNFLRLFDPKKSEEFELSLGKKGLFSNLNHNFLIVDSVPKEECLGFITYPYTIDIGDMEDLIYECILNTASKGFFTCTPCEGLCFKNIEMEFLDIFENSIFGYFDPSKSIIYELLKARCDMEDREWGIGSCSNLFPRPRRAKWLKAVEQYDLLHLLSSAENIGCLFYQEGNIVTIMCKPFGDIDEKLKQLVRITSS